MNKNLKKIMDELAVDHAKKIRANNIVFNSSYNTYHSYKEGFTAAIPYIMEEILNVVRMVCNREEIIFIEKELKRMDENE
jgi:hypothetical protein